MPRADESRTPSPEARPSVDLTNCDREPIHIPAAIQSFGALVAFSDDWYVTHASENIGAYLDVPQQEILGRPVSSLFSADTVHAMRTEAQLLGPEDTVNRLFGQSLREGQAPVDVSLHRIGQRFIVEFEPASADAGAAGFARVQTLANRLAGKETLKDLANEAARCLRALTGFDRVMVYRFNDDDSGNVIAEARAAHQPSYLGLRYPASDIPKQARALYLRSTLRIIGNVDAPTVRVLPERDAHGEPLDLSLSVARAVSPIHLQYLRNMGVAASMSVSIIRKGRLWGLIACHSERPHHIDFKARTTVELFAQFFTARIADLEAAGSEAQMREAQKLHQRMMTVAAEGKLIDRFEDLAEQIGTAIAFDGIAIYANGAYRSEGAAPTAGEFADLARFLNTTSGSRNFATDEISRTYDKADEIADRVAGMLVLPISRSPRDYIALFRREIATTVQWAGDPRKPVETEGAALTPRKSFETWKEIVKGRAHPWSEGELRLAEAVRVSLLEIVLKMADAAAGERKRAAEQQEFLIAELNHRVRNILTLIKSLLQRHDGGTSEAAYETLSARIHSVARAHDQLTEAAQEGTTFHRLLSVELDAYVGDAASRLELNGPDVRIAPEAFTSLALVIHELVTNSVKYGALSTPEGRLMIETGFDPAKGLSLTWRETGGPAVSPPTRRGFGMTIIERTVPYQMGGTAEVSFAGTGLEARFQVPQVHVPSKVERAGPTQTQTATPPTRLRGTLLLVEDNLIIALDASETLTSAGAEHVETAASVQAALALIDRVAFDAAILDVTLGTENSAAVAAALRERGAPFCLATGYSGKDGLLMGYDAPVIRKPYVDEALIGGIAALLD